MKLAYILLSTPDILSPFKIWSISTADGLHLVLFIAHEFTSFYSM